MTLGAVACAQNEIEDGRASLHPVKGHYRRKKGRRIWIPAHYAHNPGRRAKPPQRATPVSSARAKVTVIAVVSVVGVGAVTWTLYDSAGGSSLSVSDEGGARAPSDQPAAEVRLDLNRTKATLLTSGYNVSLDIRFDKNCAVNSYGKVHKFFLSHPCDWLARASLTPRKSGQGAILIAVSWVGMRNTALAKQYKRLVDAPGTGNITELPRVIGAYRKVRFTGDFYISGIDGTAVWNAEAQPVAPTPAVVVNKILDDSRQ